MKKWRESNKKRGALIVEVTKGGIHSQNWGMVLFWLYCWWWMSFPKVCVSWFWRWFDLRWEKCRPFWICLRRRLLRWWKCSWWRRWGRILRLIGLTYSGMKRGSIWTMWASLCFLFDWNFAWFSFFIVVLVSLCVFELCEDAALSFLTSRAVWECRVFWTLSHHAFL